MTSPRMFHALGRIAVLAASLFAAMLALPEPFSGRRPSHRAGAGVFLPHLVVGLSLGSAQRGRNDDPDRGHHESGERPRFGSKL